MDVRAGKGMGPTVSGPAAICATAAGGEERRPAPRVPDRAREGGWRSAE